MNTKPYPVLYSFVRQIVGAKYLKSRLLLTISLDNHSLSILKF